MVAGIAAVTIDHEWRSLRHRRPTGPSCMWPGRPHRHQPGQVWAIQMAIAPTITTPAVVSSPGGVSKVRPAMATRVAMVP